MGKRSRRLGGWLPVLLVLALVGGGVTAWHYDLADRWLTAQSPDPLTEPAEVPPPEGIDVPDVPEPVAVADPADQGRLLVPAVRRTIAPALTDPDLRRSFHAAVAPLTGPASPEYAAGRGSFTPASTLKVLTTTAALAALGPDHTFATTVVARGRALTLVGGGDPLLRRMPDDPGDLPLRADLTTLAKQTVAALRRRGDAKRPVRLGYDASLFTGPADNPFWENDYVPDDIVSPIGALWVDEGIAADASNRVDDPATDAAVAFASALSAAGLRVRGEPRAARAPARARELARVSSPPLSQIAEQVLAGSDNEGAEVLARHVGLSVLGDASFAGGVRGVRQTLAGLGVPLAGAVIRDGSGLARGNRLRPATLIEVLRVAARPDRPDLRAVLTGLPVGGFTGSLTFRFDEAPAAGVGHVRAKTGTLRGVTALAGVTTDRSGSPMAFVLAADRVRPLDGLDAEQDLDNLAGALGACRCSR